MLRPGGGVYVASPTVCGRCPLRLSGRLFCRLPMRVPIATLLVISGAFGCSSSAEIGSRSQVRTADGGFYAARATFAVYESTIRRDSVQVQVFSTTRCDASPEMSPVVGWRAGWTDRTEHALDAVGRAVIPRPSESATLYVGHLADRPDLAMPLAVGRGGFDVILVWLVADPDPAPCDIT